MYKGLLAVILAAGCAAMFVGLIPPPAPAIAAVQTAGQGATHESKAAVLIRGADIRDTGCVQAWPYYEQSCLRDGRRLDGSAVVARVIVTDKPAVDRINQAQR